MSEKSKGRFVPESMGTLRFSLCQAFAKIKDNEERIKKLEEAEKNGLER